MGWDETKIVLTYRERSLIGDGYFALNPGVGGECLWSGLLVSKSKILTKTIIFLSKNLEGLDAYIWICLIYLVNVTLKAKSALHILHFARCIVEAIYYTNIGLVEM